MSGATHIRSCHTWAYRSGEWARILTIAESEERDCYVIQFDDGATDFWVVHDPLANYEFRYETTGRRHDGF